MKVTCSNCGKRFDYEIYMGLCPKCSTYYRERRQRKEESAAGRAARPSVQGEKPGRRGHTYQKGRRSSAYYAVTFLLVFAIILGAAAPMAMKHLENVSGRKEMELGGDWKTKQIAAGEPFTYAAEDGDYQIVITGARGDQNKDLTVPEPYEYVAVSYEMVPPEESRERVRWSDHPSYFSVHMQPYLITKSGQYLEPLYPFQVADRTGWDDGKQKEMGLSEEFQFEKGVLYFLVKKGDSKGLLVNSFDYDEKTYRETNLRESFEITGL